MNPTHRTLHSYALFSTCPFTLSFFTSERASLWQAFGTCGDKSANMCQPLPAHKLNPKASMPKPDWKKKNNNRWFYVALYGCIVIFTDELVRPVGNDVRPSPSWSCLSLPEHPAFSLSTHHRGTCHYHAPLQAAVSLSAMVASSALSTGLHEYIPEYTNLCIC